MLGQYLIKLENGGTSGMLWLVLTSLILIVPTLL